MNELLVGYARVSTEQQDLTAQRNGLHALGVGDDRIYVDHGLTGTNRDRPGLRLALVACRAGDTLVVTKLDRLARSLPDARDILNELTRRNVKLSLGGSIHDPTDPVGRLLFNVLAMVAEKEDIESMTLGPLFGSAGVCMPGQSSVDADPAPAAARRTQVATKLEIFLLYLFGVGVAGSGIGGFFGRFFISDSVAESIGWPTSNPFQLEVGFANLAIGILGIVAMGRRDGFREATVIAVTVFGVGATIFHVMDVIESGNLAPGNTIQKRQQSSQARIVDRFPGCQQTSGAFA